MEGAIRSLKRSTAADYERRFKRTKAPVRGSGAALWIDAHVDAKSREIRPTRAPAATSLKLSVAPTADLSS